MADESGEKLTWLIFTLIKTILALFLIRVVLNLVGFKGYLPVVSEVYSGIMGAIVALGSGKSISFGF